MIYQVNNIIKDVRVCMDQNRTSDSLFDTGDVDNLQLDDIIASKIEEAAERVYVMAPYRLLELGHNLDGSTQLTQAAIYWDDLMSGHLLLPEDFLRLVVFKMSDWERPVYAAITADDPLYHRQHSRVKAIRGTAQRPVVAICMRPEGKVLEFYSCKSDSATIDRGVYVPRPKIDSDGGLDLSEECYKAVVYMTAGLAASACGETDLSTVLLDLAKTYLEK